MSAFTLQDGLTILGMVVVAIGAYYGTREQLVKFRGEMATTLQSIKDTADQALRDASNAHLRISSADVAQRKLETDVARLDERHKQLTCVRFPGRFCPEDSKKD